MRIFYKCSFKSSGGYKLACYDYDLDELHYIPEDDNIYKEKISKRRRKWENKNILSHIHSLKCYRIVNINK